MAELKVGEKYLTIYLLGKAIKVCAFPVENRQDQQPHFKGDGVAVYVNKKKEQKPQTEDII